MEKGGGVMKGESGVGGGEGSIKVGIRATKRLPRHQNPSTMNCHMVASLNRETPI